MHLGMVSNDGAIVDVEGDEAGESLESSDIDAWVCLSGFIAIGT
jgi:hypothetical protein